MSNEKLFELNGKPALRTALPFGLQHILAMFLANMAPIIIVAGVAKISPELRVVLIQNCMFTAAVATTIQLYPIWRIGSGLPIVMGTSFTFVAAVCGICANLGYSAALGAILVGGLFEGVLGLLIRRWEKVVAPIVSSTVVTAIGFSLFPVGVNSFCGGIGTPEFCQPTSLLLGAISLAACLVWSFCCKGVLRLLGVLFGMCVGYAAALIMGKATLVHLLDHGWFALPRPMPFALEFHWSAIISICIIFIVSMVETIGDSSALITAGLKRKGTDREFSGAIACDGFASALAALFGCTAVTSFSQNVGLIVMTKVINRFTIFSGIAWLLLASLCPPIAAFFSSVPDAVLGGCTMMMFGSIAVAGFEMIGRCGFSQRNIIIVALSLVCGFGFTASSVAPIWDLVSPVLKQVFAENQVAIVFVVSIVLNLILPKEKIAEEVK